MKSGSAAFTSADGRFAVELPRESLRSLRARCRRAGKVETGGILIGRYSQDLRVAYVSRITAAPSDSEAGPFWFERGVRGLQQLLNRLWRGGRKYYLGEWHYHPGGSSPSSEDLSQIENIARATAYRCPEPILIVLGMREDDLRVFVSPRNGQLIELAQSELSKAPP